MKGKKKTPIPGVCGLNFDQKKEMNFLHFKNCTYLDNILKKN